MTHSSGSKIIGGHMNLLKAAGAASRNVPDVLSLELHVPIMALERFTRIIENPRALTVDVSDIDRRITEAYRLASGVDTGQALILPIDRLATDFRNHKRERNQKLRPKDVCSCLFMEDLEKQWDQQPTDRWLQEEAKEQLQMSVLGLMEDALVERITDDGLEEIAETIRNTSTLIGLLLITARIRAQDDLIARLAGLERLLEHGILPIGHLTNADAKPSPASAAHSICVAVSFTG